MQPETITTAIVALEYVLQNVMEVSEAPEIYVDYTWDEFESCVKEALADLGAAPNGLPAAQTPQVIPIVEDDMFTPLTAYLHQLERHHNIKILHFGIVRHDDGTMLQTAFGWIPKQWPGNEPQATEGVSE